MISLILHLNSKFIKQFAYSKSNCTKIDFLPSSSSLQQYKQRIKLGRLTEKSKLIQVAGTNFIINKKSNSIEFPHLENEKKYTLVLNDYNFGKLKNYTRILIGAEDEKSIEDYEVLKIYAEKQQIINPKIENRITIIDYE